MMKFAKINAFRNHAIDDICFFHIFFNQMQFYAYFQKRMPSYDFAFCTYNQTLINIFTKTFAISIKI